MPAQSAPAQIKPRSQSRKLPLMAAFRLTEAELADLRERAEREQLSLSSYLRGVVLGR